MSKRRLSAIVTNVIRTSKARYARESDACLTPTAVDPIARFDAAQDVHPDVSTMAAGTAGRSLDGLVKGAAISTESFWPADIALWRASEPQRAEAAPSRSTSIQSRRGISTAVTATPPSPTAARLLASPFDTLVDGSDQASATFCRFVMQDISASPEQVAVPNAARSNHLSHASPTSSSRPGSTFVATLAHGNDMAPAVLPGPAEVGAARPPRPARPTLARLNTSEMLRTQTISSVAPAAAPAPAIARKSPSALKLQLDTSVPRRSATLSSYPHAAKSRSALPMTEGARSHQVFKSDGNKSDRNDSPTASTSDPPGRLQHSHLDASYPAESHQPKVRLSRDEFEFEVSTILPDFLYLGSDVQSDSDVAELEARGVRRILNVACEIDDSGPLHLRDRFRRYLKLPMLDIVEAQGVQDNIKQACEFLDDARLRSEPVYVHCRAGKSRSVTIVIAYLIHALRWPLARSYSYVVERRSAISPNIGFVAELMKYEQAELKLARSTGIYGDAPGSSPPLLLAPFAAAASAVSPASMHEQTLANDSRSALGVHAADPPRARTSHELATTDVDHSFGASLSQSSPDLPSLAFGSH